VKAFEFIFSSVWHFLLLVLILKQVFTVIVFIIRLLLYKIIRDYETTKEAQRDVSGISKTESPGV